MHFPENVGTGYIRCAKLPNGLQVNIINASLNQDWWIHRIKSNEEFYTLRFDELEIPESLTMAIDREEKLESRKKIGSAYLTSSLFDLYYIGGKGLKFKGINILFSKEWMAKYLGLNNTQDVFTTYLSIKADRFELEPLDEEYIRLMNEIFTDDPDNPFPVLSLQNKLLILIERFFTRLFERHKGRLFSVKINNDELERLQHVESILIKSFNTPPPSIPQLAKVAAMSPTKLKKLFKAVYGNAIYEHFQKRRMKHAAELLLTKKYSVKEVGSKLGYANLSNFTLAFKKEFRRLPSEF
ncbi:MAG: helix-turn-helix transcriptional regulator [Sphingobacteriales bacterium]|nr:helix-turn-helix transcriptional regulator [Sphingobacteriales bacterium]